MSDVIDFFEDLVGGAVDLVEGAIDVVLDAGEWVVDKIIEPVINGVGDIVDYALDNPIEAIGVVISTLAMGPSGAAMFGSTTAASAAATWAIPLASGANTLSDIDPTFRPLLIIDPHRPFFDHLYSFLHVF